MRHKKKKITLGRENGPRKALLRSLAISLITEEKVTTTKVKAKAVQQFVEPLITKAKTKDLNSIRLIEKALANKSATMHMVNTLGPRFKTRPGGYTSIVKVDRRKGDGAELVILQLLSE